MKIGIYDPYLDTLSGGEKYILTAASCLSFANEVTIFWDDKAIVEKANKKLHIDISKTIIEPNIFSKKVTLLKRLLYTKKYDLLIILSDGSIPFTLAKKTILHFQFPVEWVNSGNLLTKIKLLKINTIICNSEFTKNFIDKKFSVKSALLYPPCLSSSEINKLSLPKKDKENIILTVGRFVVLPDSKSVKKLEMMIDAFKKMIDNGLKNWTFLAVVSFTKENKKYLDNLEKTTKNYSIKIVKNIDFDELEKLYLRSKIYWHAGGFGEDIKIHPERAEHFGITTVEAMAHGIVPVVIEKGGQPEIVDNNINGFLWETEEELIQKTKKLMIDNKLLDKMANLANKKSRVFAIEKFCKELQKMTT